MTCTMAANSNRQELWRWPTMWWVVVLAVVLSALCDGVAARRYYKVPVISRKIQLEGEVHRNYNHRDQYQNVMTPQHQQQQQQRRSDRRSDRPNIIMIMTDDQDVLLGSLKAMPKLHQYMTEEGANFKNMFVSTPMCCPSRSSILTGLYVHNHNVYTNNDNCSSSQWVREHEPRTFAPYLQRSGYRTGYFGKYLNKYNGTYVPHGWDKWVGLVRNSRFYNYTLSYNGALVKHQDNYYNDYLTDRIANDSVAFFKRSKRVYRSQPVMMVLSLPAPHGPEDAAPQYQHMFVNNTDHRTPSWNVAPNMDKQWLLRQMSPMTPQYKIFTDLLQRRRLQTLQSVDDLVEKVFKELRLLGELDNTYVIYTSDHGYHLGQFGLIKGKSLAYDFDTRVPLIIRGPGIQKRVQISNVAANVDLAPTLLDMGGVEVPEHMDGQSLLPLAQATTDPSRTDSKDFIKTSKPWRDSMLLERGKVSKKMWKILMREERLKLIQQNQKNLLLYLPPKQQKILRQCSNPRKNLKAPCKAGQKWYCEKDSTGRMRLHKCRHADRERNYNTNAVPYQEDQPMTCRCSDGRPGLQVSTSSLSSTPLTGPVTTIPRKRRRRHRRFLTHRAEKAKRKARSKLQRQRRAVLSDAIQPGGGNTLLPVASSSGFSLFTHRCRILGNKSVTCDQDIYNNYQQWESHRERLDEMIKEYKKILDDYRAIREHLLSRQPPMFPESEDVDEMLDQMNGGVSCFCENDTLPQRPPLDRAERRRFRKEQKLQRRAERQEDRQKRRGQKRGRKKKNCNDQNMKCFSHDNDHWKTPPYWELFDEAEGGDVGRGCPSLRWYKRFNYPHCATPGMECTLMDNCHWKTPPFWTLGPFCFCSNANNNTYWCMRTVNSTSDSLYCEYITNFIAYYDMLTDPYQLHNVAKKLNYGILQQLHDQLATLKVCSGGRDCDLHSHTDSRKLIADDGHWREQAILEGSSGQGDDEIDNDDHYDDDDDDDEGREEEFYDYDTDPDPDFF